ncbi:MAG: alpha/beta hydrolase [Mastigocoleus sp. MO_167.B18]|nr:alpha/beta hydrolase [Mastigocoleus sp. MO_167.B18]
MQIPIRFLILLVTTSYHAIATMFDNIKYKPPGQLIDVGGYKLHLYSQGVGNVTVVIEHSLGGLDGYFLIEKIAKITRVCIYDRAGYGWSEPSPKKRCSEEIVRELDTLLSRGGIEPPYILVGDSFGSYNVRLYAHYFPGKIAGIVLTDGLYETEMLKMSPMLIGLKVFFISGFLMSIIGSILGIIRLLSNIGIFELLKKELRNFNFQVLRKVKRSFYSYQHWLTMYREMWDLNLSAHQASKANNLGNIPIISIKAATFIRRTIWSFYMPLKTADRLREKMHTELLQLSTNSIQLQATKSSHFVWVDEPEIIVSAIQQLLQH